MDSREEKSVEAEERPVVYCLIPAELAPKLHEPLRRHFRGSPEVEVIVERRGTGTDRRSRGEQRQREGAPPGGEERRLIRSPLGRRIAERRAELAPLEEAPALPRAARRHVERIAFVHRLEPPTQPAEDRDTARVVARFQAGDSEAFGTLYERYFDRVYRYLRVILRNTDEAEDVTQGVFVRVLEALPRYERRKQPFRAWLFVVARNAALDALERMGRLELMDPEELRRTQAELTDDADQAEEPPLGSLSWIGDRDLSLFIERLPLPQQQVLLLRYVVDLTDRQIAAVLNRSPSDVRMLHSRAVRFLRARLEALDRAPKRTPKAKMQRAPRHATVLRSRRWALDP